MRATEIRAKLDAAIALLSESSTTFEKARSVASLLKGINPKLDALASQCETYLGTIESATEGDTIQLMADALPEGTEEEKRRKKALLLFIKYWGDLKSEVARVQAELDAQNTAQSGSTWWSILKAAKGPLAVITLLAVGIALMAATSVDLVIKNEGCDTLYPSGTMAVSFPGLKLPAEPLVSGGSVTATIPPLRITINGTSGTALTLSSLKLTYTIQLSKSVTDVVFDGQSLLGKTMDINLSDRASHILRLVCS